MKDETKYLYIKNAKMCWEIEMNKVCPHSIEHFDFSFVPNEIKTDVRCRECTIMARLDSIKETDTSHTASITICGKCSKPKTGEGELCNCGRPSKYNEDILTKTREYIDLCVDSYEVKTRPFINSSKHVGDEDYLVKHTKIPTLEGLAFFLKVNKDTIQEWKKEHEEFSVLIQELLAKQADELINKGLSGDYNPTIAKVLLTKHGYREGIEQSGEDGKPLIPDTLSSEEKEKLLSLIKPS